MEAYFNLTEGSYLIRLVIAHIATDYIFQTNKMVEAKYKNAFKSPALYLHCLIAIITSWIALDLKMGITLGLAASIGVSHYFIDVAKIKLDKNRTFVGFCLDQLAHLIVILIVWLYLNQSIEKLNDMFHGYMSNYKFLLLVLGYLFVIWPASYIIKFAISSLNLSASQNMTSGSTPTDGAASHTDSQPNKAEDILLNAGKYIGIFERVIILTLVLYSEYEAIGFLITGKSIVRMNSTKQTEYVLAGTLLSYAIAILTGVVINWIITFI